MLGFILHSGSELVNTQVLFCILHPGLYLLLLRFYFVSCTLVCTCYYSGFILYPAPWSVPVITQVLFCILHPGLYLLLLRFYFVSCTLVCTCYYSGFILYPAPWSVPVITQVLFCILHPGLYLLLLRFYLVSCILVWTCYYSLFYDVSCSQCRLPVLDIMYFDKLFSFFLLSEWYEYLGKPILTLKL